MICVDAKFCVLSNMRLCTPGLNYCILKMNFHSVQIHVDLYRTVIKILFSFGLHAKDAYVK